jgi:hypothetical protein
MTVLKFLGEDSKVTNKVGEAFTRLIYHQEIIQQIIRDVVGKKQPGHHSAKLQKAVANGEYDDEIKKLGVKITKPTFKKQLIRYLQKVWAVLRARRCQ